MRIINLRISNSHSLSQSTIHPDERERNYLERETQAQAQASQISSFSFSSRFPLFSISLRKLQLISICKAFHQFDRNHSEKLID